MASVHNTTASISLLLVCFGAVIPLGSSQPNCSNYYSESNLPEACSTANGTCLFSSLSNSSLATNTTYPDQFELCLNLASYQIVLEGFDAFEFSVYIEANSIVCSGYKVVSDAELVFVGTTSIFVVNASLSAKLVWLQSDVIQLQNSTMIKEGEFQTACDCTSKGTTCEAPSYYFPYLYESQVFPSTFNLSLMNYTFQDWIFSDQQVNTAVLFANTSILFQQSLAKMSVIAIYSPSLQLSYSALNTTGLGYSSSTGLGCGYFDEVLNQLLGCSGTGASHGGYGGNSGPQNCNLLVSNPPYDRQTIPKYPGSGGGFFLKELTQTSAGGGVIHIQVDSLLLDNSSLISNGIGGIQGGGGGSGGSVSVDFCSLTTLSSPLISANGGNAKSSGAGGRVRFFNHNWASKTFESSAEISLTIEANGGNLCDNALTCGERGSIVAAPCPPGYSLSSQSYGCIECPAGFFQVNYGYGSCSSCKNKPQNAYYTGASEQTTLNNYSSVCSFSCQSDYKLYNSRACLSSFEYMLAGVGGFNLIICLGIVVLTLVIFLVVMLIRKLSFNDRNTLEGSQNTDFYKKKSYFKIQDIPFHETRIYFDGTNTPSDPWRVSPHVESTITTLPLYQPHIPFFLRLFRQLNQAALYSRSMGWLLQALQVFYYPLGLMVGSMLREAKAKATRRVLLSQSRQISAENLGIKLHVNQRFSVGCIEIFNYSRQTLDFYIKNYFPICLRLQQLQIGGYGIDFTDPLFKALCLHFKNMQQPKLEDYLIQLNQLLRNSDQALSIFKHLWKINSVWPSLQCHLWQPDNTVLGIDDNNQIDKSKDLFLIFTMEPKASEPSSSSDLYLNSPSPLASQLAEEPAKQPHSRHFLCKWDLPNVFFDQITCIRQKYHLRQAMVDMEERKTIFWEIENNFSEKYLCWALGALSILELLLNLLSFFLVVFLMVDSQNHVLLYAFIPYLVVFPFAEFIMIFLEFSLLISKGSRVFVFTLYFSVFSATKLTVLTLVILGITISNGFDDTILILLFFIWLALTIFSIISLFLLSMLHSHYAKTK